MAGRVEFEVGLPRPERQPVFRAAPRGPLRILVLGDFSGRANRGLLETGPGLADRPFARIDVDSFDDTLFRFSPRLHLPLGEPGGPATAVSFRCLEDFAPDALFDRLEPFRVLRETRRRLLDPESAAGAAAELRQAARPTEPRGGAVPAEDDSSTVTRLLGKTPAGPPAARAPAPAGPVDIDRLIRGLVGPYVVPGPDPGQDRLVASVDAAIGGGMRALLHHPAFQALESAWRSVHALVAGLETGEELELSLLDLTQEELALAAATANGRGAPLDRLLAERRRGESGEDPWGLLVGHYEFGADLADPVLLASLGRIAARAGGPLVAAASPRLLGCAALHDTPDPSDWRRDDGELERSWRALRRDAAARWIGLALPRVLLRLPYGPRSAPVESFDFDEMPGGNDHPRFLWGNPAFACALLIGRSFTSRGWDMEPGDDLELHGLPAHVFEEDGESKLKPCAEIRLGERAVQEILGRGLIPIVSHATRDAVRVARLQSIADPPAPLSGSWS